MMKLVICAGLVGVAVLGLERARHRYLEASVGDVEVDLDAIDQQGCG
jgi:hypothetical protein